MTNPERPSKEELRRLRAWVICLTDALAYIALAKSKSDFVQSDAFFKYKAGRMNVGHAVEKGLLAAAIVSIGQVFKNGSKGPGIASNNTTHLTNLRDQLLECSDVENGWDSGRTRSLLEDFIRSKRDKFLSHFDGNAANVREFNDTGTAISWHPPNPWFRADAFDDLESAVYQLLRSLEHSIKEADITMKTHEGDE